MTPLEQALREAVEATTTIPSLLRGGLTQVCIKREHAEALLAALEGHRWIPVSERLPEAGQQVAVRRLNGSWDRGEIAPMYFDGLPGWYLPEGPTMLEDAPHWLSIPNDE